VLEPEWDLTGVSKVLLNHGVHVKALKEEANAWEKDERRMPEVD